MRENDFAGGKVPAFIVIGLHFLEFQVIEVDSYILLPCLPVIAGAGLANLKAQYAVPRIIVYLPEHLHPSALWNVQIGFPAGRECSVRRGAHQVQGEAHVGILGGMNVYPERYAVPLTPVLRPVELQRHAGHATLFPVEAVPGGTVGRIHHLRAVHQRNPLAQRLLTPVYVLTGIVQFRAAFAHHPSALPFHIIYKAGGQHGLLRPTVQHGHFRLPRSLRRTGRKM